MCHSSFAAYLMLVTNALHAVMSRQIEAWVLCDVHRGELGRHSSNDAGKCVLLLCQTEGESDLQLRWEALHYQSDERGEGESDLFLMAPLTQDRWALLKACKAPLLRPVRQL